MTQKVVSLSYTSMHTPPPAKFLTRQGKRNVVVFNPKLDVFMGLLFLWFKEKSLRAGRLSPRLVCR